MTVTKEQVGSTLTLKLSGRLDSNAAPDLDREIESRPEGVKELVFDFENLEYIASAGLRSIVTACQVMDGNIRLLHVSDLLMEVFEITGLTRMLTFG